MLPYVFRVLGGLDVTDEWGHVVPIFEKGICNQLNDYFDVSKLFHSSQYCFRKQHSTELADRELVDRATQEMDRGEIPFGIFLDLSKAFDTLNHFILLDKLKYYEIKKNSLKLIKSYLANRSQKVEHNGIKSDYSQFPQECHKAQSWDHYFS